MPLLEAASDSLSAETVERIETRQARMSAAITTFKVEEQLFFINKADILNSIFIYHIYGNRPTFPQIRI